MLRNNKIATLPMNLLPKRKYIPGEIVLVDMFQFDNNGQTLWHHIAIDAFTKDFVSGFLPFKLDYITVSTKFILWLSKSRNTLLLRNL